MKHKKRKNTWVSGMDIDLGSDFYIEMRGQNSLAVYACRGIAEYSPERIVLHLRQLKLGIEGSCLTCDSYTNGAVLVSGHICNLNFYEVN